MQKMTKIMKICIYMYIYIYILIITRRFRRHMRDIGDIRGIKWIDIDTDTDIDIDMDLDIVIDVDTDVYIYIYMDGLFCSAARKDPE